MQTIRSLFLLLGIGFLFGFMSIFGEFDLRNIAKLLHILLIFLYFLENYVELLEGDSIMKI